ncbi:hypothetical protein ACHAQA_006860 [Verticillium albo-atrum]
MLSHALTLGLLTAVAAAYNHFPLLPRQTSISELEDTGDCISALLEVAIDAPMPPPEIQDIITNYYITATGVATDACAWQTLVPGSLADDWSSYQSEVMSWYKDNQDELSSALEKCPADYSSSAGPCTGTIAGGTEAKATGTSGGGNGSGNGNGNGNSNGGDSGSGASNVVVGRAGVMAIGAVVLGAVGGIFVVL